MSDQPVEPRELVVKVLIRAIPADMTSSEVGLDVFKALVEALRHKYAIMGYSWEQQSWL